MIDPRFDPYDMLISLGRRVNRMDELIRHLKRNQGNMIRTIAEQNEVIKLLKTKLDNSN